MNVIDHQAHEWFLFELQGKYFLDVNCNHSAFNYTYMIELSPEEEENYQSSGHEYLSNLAQSIHYSAPIAKGSNSPYKGRDVSKQYSEASRLALKAWREGLSALN